MEKIQPQSIESEQSVLGAMMISKDTAALLLGKLKKEFFYKPSHTYILEAVLNLYKKNDPIDLVTVADELKKQNKLQDAGGRSYLMDLIESVPTTQNAEKYADIIFEKWLLRQLIDTGNKVIGDAFDDSLEPKEIVEKAQKTISQIASISIQDKFYPIKDILSSVFETIQTTYDQDDNAVIGVPTGFSDLDTLTSGFQKGDLIILAARPSQGKTSLALHFAAHAAIKEKKAVAIFSLEMIKEQLGMRMLCSESGIDSGRLRTSNLQEGDYKHLVQAMGTLEEAPIFIDDTPGISPLEMRAKCRQLQMHQQIDLIIIDYLQLMRLGKARVESRFQEVSEIVRGVKAFAKEANIPIIALSQLSRDVEKRQDKRPMLSDIRESGEIEQTADLVLFIFKEEDSQLENKHQSNIQLIIAKQRNGPTGEVGLGFKKQVSKFVQLTKHPIPS